MATQQSTNKELLDPERAVPSVPAASIRSHAPVTEEPADIQFLLTEFTELAELWRHTDSRIESSINFYLTFGAVALPVLAVLYQTISNIRWFILTSLPIAGALLVVGIFLEHRITSTDVNKAGYVLGMQLIRRFFVDRYPHIGGYLYLPSAQSPLRDATRSRQAIAYYHSYLALVLACVNSLLAGGIVTGVIWLATGRPLNTWHALSGVSVAVASFVILVRSYFKRTGRTLKRRSPKG